MPSASVLSVERPPAVTPVAWTGLQRPVWQRAAVATALMALLALLTLAIRAEFPAQLAWLPAGLAVGLVAIWGPWMLVAVALGSSVSIAWWGGEWQAAGAFALQQTLLAAVGWGLTRWPWRNDLHLGTLRDMARFLVVCVLGYALAGALLQSWLLGAGHGRPAAVAPAAGPQAAQPAQGHAHSWAEPPAHGKADGHRPVSVAAHPHSPPAGMGAHVPARAQAPAPAHGPAAAQPAAHHGSEHGSGHGVRHPVLEAAMANMLGLMLCAPTLACALSGGWRGGVRRDLPWALLALATLLLAATAIYSGWLEQQFGLRHTTLFVLPPAVWLALRHSLPFTLFGNLAVVLISDVGTSLGQGPFADHTAGLPLLHLVFLGTTLLITASQSERRTAQDEVQRLATRDALTDLPNRNLLALKLETALANAERYAGRVGVLFIDLDHFKRINDSLGHEVGDGLLIAATERMSAVLRSDSMLARMGGDEFIVVLERLEDADEASRVAQRLISALQHPFTVGPHELTISCSLGVASYPDDGSNGSELVKHADIAMYQAKAKGRNQFSFFSHSMNAQVQQRLEVENGLRHALQHDGFELHYQPIYGRAGGLEHVEALLRWRKPDGTLAMPGEFIRIAEETGLIEPIGAWVLKHSAWQLQHWRRDGLCPAPMAVNLSARQLRDPPALAALVQAALYDNGLQGADLTLEITETVLVQMGAEAEQSLRALAQQGVGLALDDFGTGYSSLSYLSNLPISALKIDRSFIAGMGSENGLRLVKAMVELARGLHLRVVAEGVETGEQQRQLIELRTDALQGYLLGRPVAAAEFKAAHLLPRPGTPEPSSREASPSPGMDSGSDPGASANAH